MAEFGREKLITLWGPQTMAKLVNTIPITMVYHTQRTVVDRVSKLTYNSGGPHCVGGLNMLNIPQYVLMRVKQCNKSPIWE